MVNINNVAIFTTFSNKGKNLFNFAHVLIMMHPTTDQNMGKKPRLVQNFDEQPLVLLTQRNTLPGGRGGWRFAPAVL